MQAHHSCVYQTLFSPHQPDLLASCSTDGTVKIFDLRSQVYVPPPGGVNTNFVAPLTAAVFSIPASTTEILSIDWNKYRPFVLASAGVDKVAKVWDCRMIKIGEVGQVGGQCEAQLLGHEYAVRKVQWSPHSADVLSTASYDMTCRVYASRYSFFDIILIFFFADGQQRLPLADCSTFMIHIRSLLLDVAGHSTRREFLQAVVGTGVYMYFDRDTNVGQMPLAKI